MSDPVRWKDGGGGPTGLGELLRDAPRPRPMSAVERARTAARMAAAAKGAGVAASGAVTGGVWAKLLALVVGAGAIGLVVRALVPATSASLAGLNQPGEVAALATAGSDSPAGNAAPAVTEPAGAPRGDPRALPPPPSDPPDTNGATRASGERPGAPTAGVASVRAPRPPEGPFPTAKPPRAQGEAVNPLLEEAESLERARALLPADPVKSLAELGANARRFPGGQLVAEREYLTIDALGRVGRHHEADARARAFVQRFPDSPYAKEVERFFLQAP